MSACDVKHSKHASDPAQINPPSTTRIKRCTWSLIRLHPSISSPLPTHPIILTMPARTMVRLEMIADTQNRMLEGITKERDNAITARDDAKQDLYMPTWTRGLYITANPPTPTPNTLIEVLHDLPNDELELIWSLNWRSTYLENYKSEDAVTVNMHGRLGTRVLGGRRREGRRWRGRCGSGTLPKMEWRW